jgi:2-aminoadipate transaminase
MRYLLATARRADVLRVAVEQKVAFVPGESFFADGTGQNIARLNFSNATPERIEEGVRRLARCLEILIARRQA